MKTVIIGAGEVGLSIARHLVMEDHNVVVVDCDEDVLQNVSNTLDVQIVQGMGAHPDVLEMAGCTSADMLIAVTDSDEVNMVACQMAYSLFNVPKKIARVRHASYLKLVKGHLFTPDNMPVDVIISPDVEVASAVMRSLSLPGAFDVEEFADGMLNLVGVRLKADSPVLGVPFKTISETIESSFVAVAIFRDERVLIPQGDDHVEIGDELYFVCHKLDSYNIMSSLGFEREKAVKNAFVIGGGHVGLSICKELEKNGIFTRVLEEKRGRAEELSEILDETVVLFGHPIDQTLLHEERVGEADVVLVMTANDSTNILASVLVSRMGVENVITRINKSNFLPLVEGVNLPHVISPLEITASKILQHVRRGDILNVHTLHEGHGQVIEAVVNEDSEISGMQIDDIHLPEGVIIGAIFSEKDGVILPRGNTVVREGDRVILFSTVENINDVDQLF